jgi:CubicO group peptidase (beta-lactamase class C family)
MHAVERGKLQLDEPVDAILYVTVLASLVLAHVLARPEVATAQIMDESGNLTKPTTKITLRMLLTHTSGYA